MKKINQYSFEKIFKLGSIILLAIIIQSCDGDEASTNKEVGFQGVVSNKANDHPVIDAILTFSRIDVEDVTEVKTDAEGAYKVTLKPADYILTVTAIGFNSNVSDPLVLTSRDGYLTENVLIVPEGGFQGIVFSKANNQPISNATLTFSRSDVKDVSVVKTDAQGTYKITLKPAKYYVTVTASAGFNSFTTAPGFSVVTGIDGYQTGNFFLEAEVASGFVGGVWDLNNNPVTNAVSIAFSNSVNPFLVYSTFSNNGYYKINLPQGSYYVRAEATGYKVYDPSPGLFVATGSKYQTGNIFLTPQ